MAGRVRPGPGRGLSPHQRFAALFGREVASEGRAPGRVNLIGEHTDYNGGFVLPTPIRPDCRAWLAPRSDRQVRATTLNRPGANDVAGRSEPRAPVIECYELGRERSSGTWLDYVQGLTWALAEAGHQLSSGFDLLVQSRVPQGSGLASSAALEIAVLRAIQRAFRLRLDSLSLARLGQMAENGFVGAQTGLMDQLVATLGRPGEALFIDSAGPTYERLPFPRDADLLVIDSGIRHRLTGDDGGYNTRWAQCVEAATRLGVGSLREVTTADLSRVDALPEPLSRRARHVVEENARVLSAVETLRSGDLPHLGRVLRAGHASLRDLYDVSLPEIDLLVDLADREPDVYGARLTGGGFGGSIVALARRGTGLGAAQRVVAAYHRRTGREARVIQPAV